MYQNVIYFSSYRGLQNVRLDTVLLFRYSVLPNNWTVWSRPPSTLNSPLSGVYGFNTFFDGFYFHDWIVSTFTYNQLLLYET